MKIGIAKAFVALAFIVSLCFSGSSSYAQSRPSSKTSVLSLDPLELLLHGPLVLQYESKISNANSWAIRGIFQPTYLDYSAFGLGFAYRWYIADSRALTGLSVAPAAEAFFSSNPDLNRSGTSIEIGGDVAYKWIWDQVALEPLFALRPIAITSGDLPSYYSGLQYRISVFLGYAW